MVDIEWINLTHEKATITYFIQHFLPKSRAVLHCQDTNIYYIIFTLNIINRKPLSLQFRSYKQL